MQTLSSRQVYANPWMSVREDVVRRADGSTGIHGVLDCPDIALVIPLDGERVKLVEQYRYPVSARRWEFPSGTRDQLDSDPAGTALRELREETGLSAGALTRLGTLDVAPGMLSHRCTVFLATDLTQSEPARDLAEQDMRSDWFTRAQLQQLIADGAVCDAKSLAAYLLLLTHERSL